MARAKRTRAAQPIIDPSLPIKAVTRNSVWGLQEDDAIRMWKAATKDAEVKKNVDRYLDIFKSAFLIEEVKEDIKLVKKGYEQRGYKVAQIMFDEMMMFTWAIKKKSVTHVTDLTYENIGYISTTELLEVLNRNFGGGWGSLSRSVQNIILNNFDVSAVILPKDRLHKKGGFYEKKVKDGFEVLELEKGGWVEAIFAKQKSELENDEVPSSDSVET